MNIEEAAALHVELLYNLPGSGGATSALSDIVNLHAPMRDGDRAACRNCVTFQEERKDWPCETIATINTYAHVDGIPAGAEQWWKG